MSDTEINTRPVFPNLEPRSELQLSVKEEFIYHLKAVTRIVRDEGTHLLKAHANDMNAFDFSSSWRNPFSVLSDLNSTMESLHQYGMDALNKMSCSHLHGTPLTLQANKRWINNLRCEEETTEQPAAESEPALSQSA